MFTVICDNCGVDVNKGQEYTCWNDEAYAEDIAIESGQTEEDEKHFCPNCFTYNDDGNIVILPPKERGHEYEEE